MTSRIAGDPFAGEAQWVIEVAMRAMPSVKNIPLWFETQPIAVLENRTAADLVRAGKARDVVAYLELLGERAP